MRPLLIAYCLIFLIALVNKDVMGQNPLRDVELLIQQQAPQEPETKGVQFLFLSKKKLIKYNPVSLAFGGLLYFYQGVISQQISAECPYEISCSNFGKSCLHEFGMVKGLALTAGRLMRCNRIAGADLHPLYFTSQGKIIDNPKDYRLK